MLISFDKSYQYYLLAVGVLMQFYVTLINVDVYHEGDKFPSVVAMSQGKMIFKDVNNIYGFLVTILNTPAVHFFGSKLLFMRVFGLIIKLILIGCFIKLLSRSIDKRWAVLIAAVWLIVSPAWINLQTIRFSNGFAWPTHYGVLFLILSLLLWPSDVSKNVKSNLKIFLSGLCLAVAWSARLEFIVTWIFCTSFIILLWRRKDLLLSHLLLWVSGSLTYFLSSLLWLYKNTALVDWFNQTILVWFSQPPAQPKMTLSWISMNLFSFFSVAALGIICISIFYLNGVNKLLPYLVSFLFVILFCLFGIFLKPIHFGHFHIGAWFNEISIRGLLSFVNIFFLIGAGISIYLIFRSFFRVNAKQIPIYVTLMAICNISLLSFLHIMTADYLHLFIFTYVCTSIWFSQNLPFRLPFDLLRMKSSVLAAALLISAVAAFSFIRGATEPLYPYKNEVLVGLYDQNLKMRDSVDLRMNTVRKYSNHGIWAFCISGLPTVASGAYRGNDKWLWNLEPESWMVDRWYEVKSGDYLYVCSLSLKEQALEKTGLENGSLVEVESGEGFSILYAKRDLT